MGFEYTRFGSGFQRRSEGSDEPWKDCAADDVPEAFFAKEKIVEARRAAVAAGGRDPFYSGEDIPDGAVPVGRNAIRLPNPGVDAIAAELGLGSDDLRGRLNGQPGGTNIRVDDKRFDEIATTLGLTPKEARDRFADRA